MFCTQCGKEIEGNAKFCAYCGLSIEGTPATKNDKTTGKTAVNANTYDYKWSIIPAVLAFVLFCIIARLLGEVDFKWSTIYGLWFAALFFGLGCGALALIKKAIPHSEKMSTIRGKPSHCQNYHTVYWLIGINVLIFALRLFSGNPTLTQSLSMIPVMVMKGWLWTLATYMFVHNGFVDIFIMLGILIIFGTQVERYIGSKEFLLLYCINGVLVGVFSFIFYYLTGTTAIVMMGSSWVNFSLVFAYALFFPKFRIPVMVTVLGVIAYELAITLYDWQFLQRIASFVITWLYFMVRFGINPLNRLFTAKSH